LEKHRAGSFALLGPLDPLVPWFLWFPGSLGRLSPSWNTFGGWCIILKVSLNKINVSLKGLECISGALESISGRLGCTSGGLGLALDFLPARPWNRRGVVHLLKI